MPYMDSPHVHQQSTGARLTLLACEDQVVVKKEYSLGAVMARPIMLDKSATQVVVKTDADGGWVRRCLAVVVAI